MDTGDKASRPSPTGRNKLWDWIPSASMGYPDEDKALDGNEIPCNDSPREAKRDQQIKALKKALKEAPRINALLGTESANGIPSQRSAAVAANGKASGWLRPETQAPAATAAATATAAAAVAVAAAAPTTTVRRRLFGRAQLCENLDCRAGSSKGWEVNGARSPPPAPRGYPQPWPKPPLDLGWPTLTLNDRELTPSVDSLDIPVSSPASPMGLEAEQQQQQQQPRAFAGWRKASLALAVAPEHDVYDTCRDETVRAVVSLKAAQREPLAITCVLEHSGEPLPLAKQACHFLIDLLLDDDYLGIISRASDVRTDLPLTRMSAENRTLAHVMVDMMVRGGGSLAPHAALRPATRQQARAGMRLARSNAMNGHILFRLAEGYTGRNTKADTRTGGAPGAAAPEPGSAPISVNIMSMGGDDRLDVLQPGALSLSDMATYHIRTEDDLAEGPGDALRRLLSVVAKDVRVSVTPVEGVVLTAFRPGEGTAAASAAAATATAAAATGTTIAAAIPISGVVGSAAPASSSSAPVDIPTARPPPAATSIALNDIFAEEGREVLLELQLPQLGAEGVYTEQGSSQAVGYNPMHPTAAGAIYGRELNTGGHEEEVDVAGVVLEYTDVCGERQRRQRRESAVLRVRRRPGGRGQGSLPDDVVLARPAAPPAPAGNAGMVNVPLAYLYRRP